MTNYTRHFGAPLALAATLLVGACAKNDANNAALTTDSAAINRDLNLARRADSAQPALNDVPATAAPAPVATAPAPSTTTRAATVTPRATPRPTATTTTHTTTSTTTTPRPTTTSNGNTVTRNGAGSGSASGGGSSGTLASGSTIDLTSDARMCTNTRQVGDHFTATVSHAVSASNGVSIPAGARATGNIVALKRSENANDNIVLQVAITSISFNGNTFPVDASTDFTKVEKVRNEPKAKDVQKVATGAVIGGILGQVIGKNTKGTVIGAAAGAAAGAGVAAGTANYEGCVPDGGQITIKLNSPLNIRG